MTKVCKTRQRGSAPVSWRLTYRGLNATRHTADISHEPTLDMKKKKRLRAIVLILLLLLIYVNRESLNPFVPDCTVRSSASDVPAACRKPVKEVAPGFEL